MEEPHCVPVGRQTDTQGGAQPHIHLQRRFCQMELFAGRSLPEQIEWPCQIRARAPRLLFSKAFPLLTFIEAQTLREKLAGSFKILQWFCVPVVKSCVIKSGTGIMEKSTIKWTFEYISKLWNQFWDFLESFPTKRLIHRKIFCWCISNKIKIKHCDPNVDLNCLLFSHSWNVWWWSCEARVQYTRRNVKKSQSWRPSMEFYNGRRRFSSKGMRLSKRNW